MENHAQCEHNISIDQKDLIELKEKYNSCEDGGILIFKEQKILKEYAKYLIEYLENEFK